MHAHLGHGAALLRLGRRAEAARSFRAAQAHYPRQPLAAAGLAIAEGTPFDPAAIRSPLSRGLAYAALERPDEAASVLAQAIEQAPPGFTGWALPAEPFLLQVSDNKAVSALLKTLADRAR
jgi:tetratricopeptide (TPR) repeat protein